MQDTRTNEAPDAEHYRRVWSDEDIAAMNERSDRRRKAAIAALGSRWVGYIAPQPAKPENVKTIKRARTA